MTKVFPCAVLALLLLAGCAHHYDLTLTNGIRVTNVTKPVLNTDTDQYLYKDVSGNEHHVSAARVLEIKSH